MHSHTTLGIYSPSTLPSQIEIIPATCSYNPGHLHTFPNSQTVSIGLDQKSPDGGSCTILDNVLLLLDLP